MIIVSDGTGYIGRELVKMLQISGLPFKILTQDRKATRAILGNDAPCVTGNMDKPASLKAAFGGASRLFLTAPCGPGIFKQLSDATEVARLCGINHVTMVSGPDILMPGDVKSDYGALAWKAEEALIGSGLDYTILRPGYFMQNIIDDQAELIKSRGLMRGLILENAPIAMVDTRDIAGVAYAAMVYGGHRGQTYSLSGMPTTYMRIADTLSQLLHKPLHYEIVRKRRIEIPGFGDRHVKWKTNLERDWARVFAAGGGDFTTNSILELTGYPPRTIEEFLVDHIGFFIDSLPE